MSTATDASSRPESNTHIELFGLRITRTTMVDAVGTILGWCRAPRGDVCRFVVTPNTDHAVLYQNNALLRAAYTEAALVLADGAPLVVAANAFGKRLPERVAGSDLVPKIFEAAGDVELRVFLLGAAPGVAETAAKRIEKECQCVRIVGTYSPPFGFEGNDAENARIILEVNAAQPDLLIVGFGAPRQELWVHRYQRELTAKVAICAGATIDFLAGNKRRSPLWMRRAGLEWLHRLGSEPRRLAARYARDAWVLPQLLWQEWRRSGT